MAMAQQHSPWELTLGGNAENGRRFDGVTGGITGSLGYFFGDNFEAALRQNVSYSDLNGVSLDGGTDVAADLHFPLGDQGQFAPYVGANIGYLYGENGFHDTFEAGPEGGLKVFVNTTTFIFVSVQYEFFFTEGHANHNNFSNGQFVYDLGIGFRF